MSENDKDYKQFFQILICEYIYISQNIKEANTWTFQPNRKTTFVLDPWMELVKSMESFFLGTL